MKRKLRLKEFDTQRVNRWRITQFYREKISVFVHNNERNILFYIKFFFRIICLRM